MISLTWRPFRPVGLDDVTIFNLGSINGDHFYRVPRFVEPGETLAAQSFSTGLGGKGANQSVAAARLGSTVFHIGCVGREGLWARELMESYGVNVDHVCVDPTAPTGHAVIFVTPEGENAIVVLPGTNQVLDPDRAVRLLSAAEVGDVLLLQNETNGSAALAQEAKRRSMFVVYSAAPFDVAATQAILPFVDLLVLNAIEAGQLSEAVGTPLNQIPVPELLITYGSGGARWRDQKDRREVFEPALKVTPVDTTGAGDTFIGTFMAARDQGNLPPEALRVATAAAALQVTREGTAEAMPDLLEVQTFMSTEYGPEGSN